MAITSQQPTDNAVSLDAKDLVDGTLPKQSFVKVAKIFTMHSTLVLKRICALSGEKLEEVMRELRSFFS